MKIEDLVVLANAGFSKTYILVFAGQNQFQIQNQYLIQNQNQNQIDMVLDAINKLTATIQASNIQNTGNGGVNSPRTEKDIINDMMKIMN